MNSVTGVLGPGGVFGASVVEVLKPEFFAVAPEARFEGYQHPIPRLKKDKVKRGWAIRIMGRRRTQLGVWRIVAKARDEWTDIRSHFFSIGRPFNNLSISPLDN